MTRPEVIFVPVSILALWTGAVLLLTGARRILAVRQRRVKAGAFALGETPDVPADVALPNRNLMNLLEMPVLFYVVSLAHYVTHQVTDAVVVLAWVYVVLRLAHSLVHLTTNRVVRRLVVFALSNIVLVTLWISFLARVL
jgi:hypothetical protein